MIWIPLVFLQGKKKKTFESLISEEIYDFFSNKQPMGFTDYIDMAFLKTVNLIGYFHYY